MTKEFVTEVIQKEKPDGVFLQFGGQVLQHQMAIYMLKDDASHCGGWDYA